MTLSVWKTEDVPVTFALLRFVRTTVLNKKFGYVSLVRFIQTLTLGSMMLSLTSAPASVTMFLIRSTETSNIGTKRTRTFITGTSTVPQFPVTTLLTFPRTVTITGIDDGLGNTIPLFILHVQVSRPLKTNSGAGTFPTVP